MAMGNMLKSKLVLMFKIFIIRILNKYTLKNYSNIRKNKKHCLFGHDNEHLAPSINGFGLFIYFGFRV